MEQIFVCLVEGEKILRGIYLFINYTDVTWWLDTKLMSKKSNKQRQFINIWEKVLQKGYYCYTEKIKKGAKNHLVSLQIIFVGIKP